MAEKPDTGHVGYRLLNGLQPFSRGRGLEVCEPGDVAAWPAEALYDAGAFWIGDPDEHDRDRLGCFSHRCQDRRASGKNDIRGRGNQLSGVSAKNGSIAGSPAIVDANVAALNPSQLAPRRFECPDAQQCFCIACAKAHNHADSSYPLALLRASRERPRQRRAAEEGDELAPLHSITSSARASSVGGTSTPSVFAVLRLTARRNLVGC